MILGAGASASAGPRILGLGGSLRTGSSSAVALRYAIECVAQLGADAVLLTTRDLDLPLYDDRPDPATYPDGVRRLLAEIRRADGIIVASPVYHGTMSGSVKNAIDFIELMADDDRPWLEGKVAGAITVSSGRPRTDAIVALEIAFRALHAWTIPFAVAISEKSFVDGVLRDDEIRTRIERLSRSIVDAAGSLT